ncbi:PREDICTED: uncharacterized protein LOC105583203 [Cercocebus atys]|uniref:uncharacterized protein LOC105583203 n=1 Tax=Cercocebus atys TaxID=9531 RepID=UPI0005F3B309|nr:PREDICTED: uncharacterized protein LOC105583203 [Cercocebus atys]
MTLKAVAPQQRKRWWWRRRRRRRQPELAVTELVRKLRYTRMNFCKATNLVNGEVVSSFPGPVRDSALLQVCICTIIKCDSLSKLCLNYRMIFHVCAVVFSIPGPVRGHCGCVQLKSSNWKYKPKFWRVRAAEI